MKSKLTVALASAIILFTQQVANAQWNLAHYDQVNYFTYIETINGDHALSAGLETSGSSSFLMRTNDGGLTWDSITISPSCLVTDIMFTDVDHGYAGGVFGNQQVLLRTDDNGSTWTAVTPNVNTSLSIYGISFLDPVSGFVSDESQVHRTLDGGVSWTSYTPGMSLVDIGFSSMDIGYACGSLPPYAAVMKTTDGGVTWSTVLTTTLPFFTISSMQKVEVVNQDIVYVSGQYSNKLFKTTNGGLSWDTINVSVVNDVTDFDFATADEGHVVSYLGEIYATADGGLTWTLEYTVASGAYGPSVLLTSMSFFGNQGYICGSNGLIKKHGIVPTSIDESASTNGFSVYPNPVRAGEMLHISVPATQFEVELTDISGRRVGVFNSVNDLLMPEVLPGIYSLCVSYGNIVSRKMISISE